jgi:hypothetical protein
MKPMLGKPFLVVTFLLVINPVLLAAPAPGSFGRNLDDIVALAKKEGKVLIGGGLADDESKMLAPFMQKYPEIKVENTRLRTPEHK